MTVCKLCRGRAEKGSVVVRQEAVWKVLTRFDGLKQVYMQF